ncbi:Hypothetical predicted protein [Cloeon dipterum]|uniref:FBD domain-containing protein n=1 Tax=Cloeon dipterum TaxID=197152 RepID=A0A8S1CX86_9INSE|nr:Hypothetical predicted protein [Cloeon dipterum]
MCPAPALPKNMNIDNLTEISLSELSAIFRPYVVVKLFTAPALRTLVLKDLWIDISSVTVALNDIVSSAAQVASKLVFLEVSVRCPTQHLNEHGKFREDVPDNWTDLMTYILCNAPLLSNVYLKNCVPELSNIVNAINQRSQFE